MTTSAPTTTKETATKFYLTTAIDYPNSLPHVGTAFEKIGADVQARYRRFKGDSVFFLMGNDENTWKVAKRARELGEDPKSYVDRMAVEFKKVWDALDISYDDFIQTTEPRHIRGVDMFLRRVIQQGFVYKKKYTGLYCDGCEAFKTPKEIEEGRCPNHKNQELRPVEEENYFFKLSEFKDQIKALLIPQAGPHLYVEPESRRNEVLAVLEGELEDISISRRNLGWGIPFPNDDTQVVYVWFDALLNYMTGCGFLQDLALGESEPGQTGVVRIHDGEPWGRDLWPADIHFIGKDITRFHCIIWPAMIAAHNAKRWFPAIQYPKKVFAHGFVKSRDGTKIGKSTGNFVDPMEIVKEFGCDPYRYYFLSRCDYGSDGEYDRDHFIEVYNSDLANNLGNLLSRTISMTLKYFDGKLPDVDDGIAPFGAAPYKDYCKHMEACEYRVALEDIWRELSAMNAYIDEHKPWALYKADKVACGIVLGDLINGLRATAILLKPFLPQTSRKIYESFTFETPWDALNLEHFRELLYVPGSKLGYNLGVARDILDAGRPTPLFQRYDGRSN